MSTATEEADEPRIPEAIREHAAQFKTPAVYAGFGGADWVLCAEDGEVVDICNVGADA